jgi:hypothetical protein
MSRGSLFLMHRPAHAHPRPRTIRAGCRNDATSGVIPLRTQNGIDRCVSPPHENHSTPSLQASRPEPALSGFWPEWGSLQVTNVQNHQASELLARALRRGGRLGPYRRFTMKIALPTLIAAVAVAAVAFTTPADTMAGHVSVSPEDIKWGAAPAMLPPGAEAALLFGDPGKEGCASAQVSKGLPRSSTYRSSR